MGDVDEEKESQGGKDDNNNKKTPKEKKVESIISTMSIRVVHLLLQARGRCLMEKIGPNVLCHKLQLSKQKQQLSDGNGSNSKMWYYPVCDDDDTKYDDNTIYNDGSIREKRKLSTFHILLGD